MKQKQKDKAASAISAFMRQHRDEIVQFVTDLMRIESQTYDEGKAVARLAEQMKKLDYDEVRIDSAGNCLGRMGNGPISILADAHIDTVAPGDPADWGFDPLAGLVEDDCIKGRGIIDDKGCLSAMLYAGAALKQTGLGSNVTFWVSGSISEEDVEGSCVKAMMEEASDIHPDAIIVGEASGMRIVRGHKGRALIKMEVQGKAAHASAAWRGENALIKALPLIQGINDKNDFIEDPFLGGGTIEVTKVDCDTPSLNTIPGKVTVFADRRISRGETKDELLSELNPLLQTCGAKAVIDTEKVTTYTGHTISQEDYFPSWELPADHPIIKSAVEAYTAITGDTAVIGKWDFCTNATYLCGITGIPSVGFGPGDESLCHGTEEKLSIDELLTAASVYTLIPVRIAENALSRKE